MLDLLNKKADMNNSSVSVNLVRTNPRLSGNLKIVVDSNGDLFLSTFDGIPSLSSSNSKRFPIYDGEFYGDALKRFLTKTKILPSDLLIPFQSKVDSSIEKTFDNFYEDLYWNGAKYKDSLLYTERIALNATLWCTKQLPSKFVIFESEGPFSELGNSNSFTYNSVENWIKNSKIIKTVDLVNSKVGKFLETLISDKQFTEMPLRLSLNSASPSEFLGISLESGKWTSHYENLMGELLTIERTILEREDLITKGFSRGSMICANLINFEFLFDVSEATSMNKYFGLFCDFDATGEFIISQDREQEFYRYFPSQSRTSWNNLDDTSRNVSNSEGVVIFHDHSMMQPLVDENYLESRRFLAIEDSLGNLKSISNVPAKVFVSENVSGILTTLIDDKDFIRIKDTELDLSALVSFSLSGDSLKADFKENVLCYPNCLFTIKDNPSAGDSIRIKFVDPSDSEFLSLADFYTIVADSSLAAGKWVSNAFSSNGSLSAVAKAISGAISSQSNFTGFFSFSFGESVVVYSLTPSSIRNFSEVHLYTSKTNTVFDVSENFENFSSFSFESSPVGSSPIFTSGILTKTKLVGFSGSKYRITKEEFNRLKNREIEVGSLFISKGSFYFELELQNSLESPTFCRDLSDLKFDSLGNAVESNNVSNYYFLILDSDYPVRIFEQNKNKSGILNIFPIADFDYSTVNTEYANRMESDRIHLLSFLDGTESFPTSPVFPNTVTNLDLVTSALNDSSSYVVEGEDYRLTSDGVDLKSEYDFLKENELKELSIVSKVVPWICKWTKKDGDIRDVQYRIPVSNCFSSSFSPSHKEFSSKPRFHTHEWPLITSKLPHVDNSLAATWDDYIKEGYDADLQLTDDSSFDDFFTLIDYEGIEIQRQFRWSLIEKDPSGSFSCFFRGASVIFKKKTTLDAINYNAESIEISSDFDFSGYRFACILIPKGPGSRLRVLRNDINRSVVLAIEADYYDDIMNGYTDGMTSKIFTDRCHLYVNSHKLRYDNINNVLKFADVEVSGAIQSWTIDFSGKFTFIGTKNTSNLTDPDFLSEIFPGENGDFSDIVITIGTDILRISAISKITSTTIEAFSLTLNGFPISVNSSVLASSILYGYIVGSLTSGQYIYEEGGYKFLSRIIEKISFASISDDINLGNPEVEYVAKLQDGTLVSNDYFIEIAEPSLCISNSYLTPVEDERPSYLKNQYGSIGSTLIASSRISAIATFKYSSEYRPKFKFLTKFSLEPSLNSNINSVNRNHRFFSDKLFVSEIYFNKVSANRSETILISQNLSNISNVYPKIGEVSVDYKDKILTNSFFDFGEARLYSNKTTWDDVFGLIAKKTFCNLGSSVVELTPNNILFDAFVESSIRSGIAPSSLESQDILTRDSLWYSFLNGFIFTIDVEKILANKLTSLLMPIFSTYLTASLESFLNLKFGSVEKFLIIYCHKNLIKRYEVSSINLYSRNMFPSELNLSPSTLDVWDFTSSESVKVSTFSKDLNFNTEFRDSSKLNFNFVKKFERTAKIYSLSFSCILR